MRDEVAVEVAHHVGDLVSRVGRRRVSDPSLPQQVVEDHQPAVAEPRHQRQVPGGEVEAELEGDPVTIAFNARYMVEALQNMEAEQLAVELSGPLAPGVLKPVDDPAYVHVIMPVRTPS